MNSLTERSLQVDLGKNVVHVWIADIDSLFPNYFQYKALLCTEELQRESKFVFEYLRKRFAISRGILRTILRGYLQSDDPIDFSYGPNGKPCLKDPFNNLHFNLSHSNGLAVYGIANRVEIGVDIEHIKTDFLEKKLEEYVFSEAEKSVFNSLKIEDKTLAFYQAWTRKEAVLKALGKGLSDSPTKIEVTFEPSVEPKILRIHPNTDVAHWSIHSFNIRSEYVGAVVVNSPSSTIKLFHWV